MKEEGNGRDVEQEAKMSKRDETITPIIHVRQSWVETTGASAIFASANVALGQGDILGVPVTRWDISDEYFVEFTFYPRALEKEPIKSIKVLIPKKEGVPHRRTEKARGDGQLRVQTETSE
jgi:hypothetical protein